MKPLVAIIIPNWNGKKLLNRCLNSIRQNTEYEQYTVIVVDNGSTDGSDEMIKGKFPEVKLIENHENLGFSKAVNIGINSIDAGYYFLLNNDTEVTKKWLWNMIEIAESKPEIGIVGCKLLYPDGRIQNAGGWIRYFPQGIMKYGEGEEDTGRYDRIREVDWAHGAALLIKKAVIEDVGLLDENFSPMYGEEVDFCMRAKKRGYKIVYNPETVVVHHESATAKTNKDLMHLARYKNCLRFILLNFPLLWLIIDAPFELVRIFRAIYAGKVRLLLKAYRMNLGNINEISGKRRERDVRWI